MNSLETVSTVSLTMVLGCFLSDTKRSLAETGDLVNRDKPYQRHQGCR